MRFLWRFAEGLSHLVLPPGCWCCDAALGPNSTYFCPSCEVAVLGDVSPVCLRCAATRGPHLGPSRDCSLCRGLSFAFTDVCRLGPYEGELRRLVLTLKQPRQEPLAEILGRCLADRVQAAWPGESFAGIVPVPLHWWRRWRRGYNQSQAIAEGLSAVLQVPCRPAWLRRIRPTSPQPQLSPTARKLNVRDAFAVPSNLPLQGRPVLLVDDILTTGATCDAAARELSRAGASHVRVAILSRAG